MNKQLKIQGTLLRNQENIKHFHSLNDQKYHN